MLDKQTSTWYPKAWTGLTIDSGKYIWTYGDGNYYYSYGSTQYVLPSDSSIPSYKYLAINDSYIKLGATYTLKTFTISSWTADATIAPFTYKATVTATTTIGADTIVELLNNNAINFATHNFSIGDITGQNITIYSVGEPSSAISLKVRIWQ